MNNKWWEHYDHEPEVLIEDVGKTHEWMGDFLKIWADRYGFRAEIKQDSMVLRPEVIIVTSNYHPKDLWPDPSVHEPILRRFQLVHFSKISDKGQFVTETEPVAKKAKRNNCTTCYLSPCECNAQIITVPVKTEADMINVYSSEEEMEVFLAENTRFGC